MSVIAALAVLASFSYGVEAQRQGAPKSVDWPLHNLDLAGSRFSTLDQINKSNVKTLTPRWSSSDSPWWSRRSASGIGSPPPQIYNGMIYIGTTRSESHIPGGHVLAVDAKTWKVLWHFNTIPQDDKDQGWDIGGPTWVDGERNGGGIWETPSIDPELGMLYVAVANPFGDSTKRAGINLFYIYGERRAVRRRRLGGRRSGPPRRRPLILSFALPK